jgi:hypothetical protein
MYGKDDKTLFEIGDVLIREKDRCVLVEKKWLTASAVEMITEILNLDCLAEEHRKKVHTFGMYFSAALSSADHVADENTFKYAMKVKNGIFTKEFLHIAHDTGGHWILISVVRPFLVSGVSDT